MESKLYYKDELCLNHLFSSLADEQLLRIVDTMKIRTLKEGEQLFECDQETQHFFLLRFGQIKLYRLSPDGTEKVIEIVAPGQSFAEAIMFMEHNTYPVNAEALVNSEIFVFNNMTFLSILRENIDTCFKMMAVMSMRLRGRLDDIEAISLQNGTLRLVNYLLNQLPVDVEEHTDVQLIAPKAVVASRLSVQPQSFSRILNNLTQAGLISVKGSIIHINNIQGLRDFIV